MHLIFGGAYQGMLEYAKKRYELREEDVFTCSFERNTPSNGDEIGHQAPNIDFSKKIINNLEEMIKNCLSLKIEAKDYFEEHLDDLRDKIIICTDISGGLVPYEEELRAWREMVGRTMVYLGKEAEEVTRLFCGIPQKMK